MEDKEEDMDEKVIELTRSDNAKVDSLPASISDTNLPKIRIRAMTAAAAIGNPKKSVRFGSVRPHTTKTPK